MSGADGLFCLTTLARLLTDMDGTRESFVPEIPREDHHRDPSTTSRRLDNNSSHNARQYRLDLSEIDVISVICKRLESLFDAGIDFLNDTHIPIETVYQISILALGTTMMYGEVCRLLQEAGISMEFSASVLVFWMIPISTLVCSFSSAVVVSIKWYPNQVIIFFGLISLFLVECLFPITVTVSVALFLCETISCVDALVLCASMLLVGSMNSWCIRAVLYPSLGFG